MVKIKMSFFGTFLLFASVVYAEDSVVTKYEQHSIFTKENTLTLQECYDFALALEALRYCSHHKDNPKRLLECEKRNIKTKMQSRGYTETKEPRKISRCFLDEVPQLTDVTQLAMTWQSKVDKKHQSDEDFLMSLVSEEYRNAEDEFARNDLAAKTQPILQKQLEEGKKRKRFTVMSSRLAIEEYDFKRGGYQLSRFGLMKVEGGFGYNIEAGKHQEYFKVLFSNLSLAK